MITYLFFFTLFVFFLAFFTRRLNSTEMRLLWLGFAMHALFAGGQVFYTLYVFGGGDMLGYHKNGEFMASLVRSDISLIWDLLLLALGQNVGSFGWVRGAGTSTGSMPAISGLASLLVGDSLVTKCLLFSMASFLGKIALYFSFKPHLPKEFHRRALIATVLLPSVVFWSSGIIKEAVAITGLGLLMLPVSRWLAKVDVHPILWVIGALGAIIISISKSYVLVVFCVAGAVWFLCEKSRKTDGSFKLTFKNAMILLGLGIVLVLLIGVAVPEYSLEEVGAETASLQHSYRRQESAGSTVQMVEVSQDEGLGGQVMNFPIAVVSSLFRPFIVEVTNFSMFINALETTFILFLFLQIFYKRGAYGTWNFFSKSPLLIFLFVYVVIFAVALGLTAPNLGTLSRYRIPMFPMYLLLLFCLLPQKTRHKRRSKMDAYAGNTARMEKSSSALARPALPISRLTNGSSIR